MISQVKNLIRTKRTFILYAIIGASGVTIDFIVFFLLFNLFGFEKNISNIISISLGITNNFILNIIFNFKTKDRIIRRFITFYSVGMVGLLLTTIIFIIFVDLFAMNPNIVKLFSIVIVVIVQYSLNKRLSFKKF